MSNPSKKIKLDFGSVVTLDRELNEHQQKKRKLPQPASTTAKNEGSPTACLLLDLNDDCLIAVAERCRVWDLHSFAQSTKRMKEIVFNLFKRKYKSFLLNFGDIVSVETVVEVIQLLTSFGSLIEELEIWNWRAVYGPDSAEIMDAVIQFCTSLNFLKLSSIDLPDNKKAFDGMRKLFGRLQKLHLQHVFIDCNDVDGIITSNGNCINFFANCKSLVEVKVMES